MKRATTSPPFKAEEIAAALKAAPERADDSACGYDPNDPAAVGAAWENAFVSRSLPELREKLAVRRRGPQKAPLKTFTGVRLDADIVEAFKSTGKGWQTRLNGALRDWLKTHSPI
jgi:uncharacterized protein (DUF4415 family)